MAYATVADMEALFGTEDLVIATAERGQSTDTVDEDRVSEALSRASDEIDSWLRRRYVVPVTTSSIMLTQLCCQIARYRLFAASTETTATEQMRTDYKDAVSWLRSVNEGRATLDGAVEANRPGTFSSFQARPPVFGLDGGPFG